jgi:hypothetical protein
MSGSLLRVYVTASDRVRKHEGGPAHATPNRLNGILA